MTPELLNLIAGRFNDLDEERRTQEPGDFVGLLLAGAFDFGLELRGDTRDK